MITLIAVFLLQFLMKFADRLVGKGLDTWVIIKLIVFNLAWMVVLVVPMAVLVATLMAFGGMAQNNEIAVLKSSGMSLYKMVIPPLIGALIVAFGLIQFNNYIYPEANHAARILMQDISKKKPTLSLVPGVFSQDVRNYSILAREIDEKSNIMRRITIFDNSTPQERNIITAESGKIYFLAAKKKLIMDLEHGEIHKADITDDKPYQKLIFTKHRIAMEADQFSFEQSSLSGNRSDRELGAPQMVSIVDSLELIGDKYNSEFIEKLQKDLIIENAKPAQTSNKPIVDKYVYAKIKDRIRAAHSSIKTTAQRIETNKKTINNYWVEIHKKYSIPAACIVFILVGAPLGTMTRKGGFGVAAGISLVFFTVYWAFLIGGEKLADRDLLSPFWGTWSANIVIGIFGGYLLYKSAKERITLSFEWLKIFTPKHWRNIEKSA